MQQTETLRFLPHTRRGTPDLTPYSPAGCAPALALHRQLSAYAPTPLRSLPGLARRLGLRAVLVKDESGRFGLKAFKGLGGVYAMYRMICQALGLDPERTGVRRLLSEPLAGRVRQLHFVTTTDGNHGKGVSWAAGLFGCQAHVYLPAGTVPARVEAIRQVGNATAELTALRYDDCVAFTRGLAEARGWLLIQDTAWPGYEDPPRWMMQGYATMLSEAAEQLRPLGIDAPTHLLLQAGVGSMAAAIAAAARCRWGEQPYIALAEASEAACFFESWLAGDGLPHEASGSGVTTMAGLNCAKPSTLAWMLLEACCDGAFACADIVSDGGMRLLARPGPGDSPIVSGESGAVTAGLLALLTGDSAFRQMREAMGLGPDSAVLLLNTEGDTDPERWRQVTGACGR